MFNDTIYNLEIRYDDFQNIWYLNIYDNTTEIAILLGDQHSSEFAEPYLFIGRHTIELMLKAIIMLGQEYHDLSFDLPITHDLNKLWTAAYPMMNIYSKMDKKKVQCVKKFIAEIQRIDPNATKFKYPVDKGNQPIERKSELASFKRSTYVDKFRETVEVLSKIVDAIKFKNVLKELDKKWLKAKSK